MYYPCLDNLHTTESGANGTVVASGIVAQLLTTDQLLNEHRQDGKTHQRYNNRRAVRSEHFEFKESINLTDESINQSEETAVDLIALKRQRRGIVIKLARQFALVVGHI